MIKRFMKFFFCTIALIVTIGVPIVAVQDAMQPWELATKYIEQERANFFTFAVGLVATGSKITQKSYALIPKGFSAPSILVVDQAENGEITIEKDQWFFWFLSAFFFYGFYLIIRLTRWFSTKLKGSLAASIHR